MPKMTPRHPAPKMKKAPSMTQPKAKSMDAFWSGPSRPLGNVVRPADRAFQPKKT